MSQALRKLTAPIGKSRTILIFINQIRMKIGIMFGNPETTTGGNALKFYSSVRLEVRKTETIEKGDEDAIGNRVRVKVVKNKVAPPFRRVELEIIFGKGVSAIGSLLDGAAKYEIIDKKGAWYSYGEEKIGQGRENAKEYLETHPDFTLELERKLRQRIFPGREFPLPAKAPAAQAVPAADSGPAAPAAQVVPAADSDPAAPAAQVVPAANSGPAAPAAQAVPAANSGRAAPAARTAPAAAPGRAGTAAAKPAYPKQENAERPARRPGPGRPPKNAALREDDGLF
jgi:recombination protein RecA